jgi:Ca2+-transporting ATPase
MNEQLRDGGLSGQEAALRLAREGPNEIPSLGRRSALRIAVEVVGEPMFALLLGASLVYLVLGELSEAIALALFATFSVSIALVQEVRSEGVLAALRNLASPRALVVRDGRQQRIAGREVVRGDLLVLSEGDRVPADAWIVDGSELAADESLLTGESVPVRKRPAPEEDPHPLRAGGEDLPLAFSGTLIVRGHGVARVVATGPASAIGKIGGALAAIRTEAPRLREETRRIVRGVAVAGFAVSATAGALYGLAQHSWLNGLLSGIAVGMSMLPEEFPLVLAVFMVMGAWRIARARVLTRRAASIETLGAVTVLCTDKTGTLTANKMRVAHLETPDGVWRRGDEARTSADSVRHLMHVTALAGLPEPFDPMERAMHELMQEQGREPAELFAGRELAHRQGVTAQLLAMTQVWRTNDARAAAAMKGAPEAVLSLCDMDEAGARRILGRASELAAGGMRLLAVAEVLGGPGEDVGRILGRKFRFLGLVGFADPVRDSVPAAVRECRRAGIRVVMITGDYPETARAIAAAAGIDARRSLSGQEMFRLDDSALRDRVRDCDVFARIMPEQKLRIIEALKSTGEVVGMTGDGVNDAPSLRAAHIGIAMGQRGTDVAREAASIVLLDDDFGSIVATVRLGRRIYDNLRKAMGYILSVHVPIAGVALLPILLGQSLILTPVIIALLEMIIDPACSIIFEAEPEERDVMDRPPRNPHDRLLDRRLVVSSLALGALALGAVGLAFVIGLARGGSEADLRTLVLVSLVTTNIALIFTHRSFSSSVFEAFARPNRWLWLGIVLISATLAIILMTPMLRDVFALAAVHGDDFLLSVLPVAVFVITAWGLRPLLRRLFRGPSTVGR